MLDLVSTLTLLEQFSIVSEPELVNPTKPAAVCNAFMEPSILKFLITAPSHAAPKRPTPEEFCVSQIKPVML